MKVEIYDTTLRDGTQAEGVSFTVEGKVRVARALDELGVPFIEGGWPGSNPKDAEFFRLMGQAPLRSSTLVAFSFLGRLGLSPGQDPTLASLLDAGTDVVTVVGKSRDLHVEKVLGLTLEENLQVIAESIAFLRSQGKRVFYDAEQFFDGHKANPGYALRTLEAAARAGAEVLILCDTNGGTMPWEIEAIVKDVRARIPTKLGIHAHNDCEMAVANTLAAVRAGVVQVQGTINGYGERVGNANLATLLPTLELKLGVTCLPPGRLAGLVQVSRLVDELANLTPNPHLPFVGSSAFTHKAGLHADATMKHRESYQHVRPEEVGNRTRIVVSDLSGKGNIRWLARELGLREDLEVDLARAIVQQVKRLEHDGYVFERAPASFALVASRALGSGPPVEVAEVALEARGKTPADATTSCRLAVFLGARTAEGRAEAADPVQALALAALDAAPRLDARLHGVQLEAHQVETFAARDRSTVAHRVLARWARGDARWTTMGCAPGPLGAVALAIRDGLEFPLSPGGRP